jgi:hypothetical protein
MFACFHSLINNASKFPGASKREKRGKNWSFSFMQTALNNVLAGLALFCQTSPHTHTLLPKLCVCAFVCVCVCVCVCACLCACVCL